MMGSDWERRPTVKQLLQLPSVQKALKARQRELYFKSLVSSSHWPGVDVMITIFCDFCQFSAKKMAFFLNTNVMIIFFSN
jgi:hypothetical protein